MNLKGRDFLKLLDFTPSEISKLIDLAAEMDIVNKSGAWYSYEGVKIAQGREKAVDYLENNLEVAEEIKNKIITYFNDEWMPF